MRGILTYTYTYIYTYILNIHFLSLSLLLTHTHTHTKIGSGQVAAPKIDRGELVGSFLLHNFLDDSHQAGTHLVFSLVREYLERYSLSLVREYLERYLSYSLSLPREYLERYSLRGRIREVFS